MFGNNDNAPVVSDSDKRISPGLDFLYEVAIHAIATIPNREQRISYVETAKVYTTSLENGENLGTGFDPNCTSIDELFTIKKFEDYQKRLVLN